MSICDLCTSEWCDLCTEKSEFEFDENHDEKIRADERVNCIKEFVEYLKQFMWFEDNFANENVIGEFQLEESAKSFIEN